MPTRRNPNCTKTPVLHQYTTAEIALQYQDMIIQPAKSVDMGIMDMEGNKAWKQFTIHTFPLL